VPIVVGAIVYVGHLTTSPTILFKRDLLECYVLVASGIPGALTFAGLCVCALCA
jgi:hypothetical protein